MQLNKDGFPEVRIGPLTEANRWSEKTVSKNEPTAIKQVGLDDGKVDEGKEKVRRKKKIHVKTLYIAVDKIPTKKLKFKLQISLFGSC